MTAENDAVGVLRMVLRKLARDPRAIGFRLAEPLTLLEQGLRELTERQADISLAVLQLDNACGKPLDKPLRDRLQRFVYGAQLPRVQSDD